MAFLNAIKSKLDNNLDLKHILTHLSGNVLGNMITLLGAPIIARLYTPEQFGIYGLFGVIIAPLQVLSSWRYEMAIVLPKEKKEAKDLISLSIVILLTMAIVVFLLIISGKNVLVHFTNEPRISQFLLFIPLSFLIVGFYNILNYWATRTNRFKEISISRIYQSSTLFIMQCLGAFLYKNSFLGLLMGLICGQIMGAMNLFKNVLQNQKISFKKHDIGIIADKYKALPFNMMQTAFLNTCTISLLPIMISFYFGSNVLGLILFIERIILAPMSLIVRSIWATIHSRLGKLDIEEKRLYLGKIHAILSFVFAFPFAFIIMFSDSISQIFGSHWSHLSLYLPAYAIMIYINSISNATSYFVAFGKFRMESIVNIGLFLTRVSILFYGGRFLDEYRTIILYAIGSSIYYLFINCYWGRVIKKTKMFLFNIIAGLGCSLVIGYLVKCASHISITLGILSFIAFTILYFVPIWKWHTK